MNTTLEIRHFKLVYFIAQERSITKATRHLHLSQPALSRQLLDLEDRIGGRLFHRAGKTMQLTEMGRRLLVTAEQVLDLVARTETDLCRLMSGLQGTIRLSTECYTSYRWLPAVINVFRKNFPDVVVDINTAVTSNPVVAVREGLIDLALVYADVSDPQVAVHTLFWDELVAVMHPDHPLAIRTFLEATDFANEHLILYSPEKSDVMNHLLRPAGIYPRRVSGVQITDGILEMVKAGLGLSVVARWAASDALANGHLQAVPLTQKGFHRQWKAVTWPHAMEQAYLANFVSLLQKNHLA